jgi:RNA polymerase sigma-54 factor
MQILQLPVMALEERIQQELQENPVLELKEVTSDDQTDDGEDKPSDLDPLAPFDDWEDRYYEEHRPSRNRRDEEGDKKHDAMQNMPSRAAVAAGLSQRSARVSGVHARAAPAAPLPDHPH